MSRVIRFDYGGHKIVYDESMPVTIYCATCSIPYIVAEMVKFAVLHDLRSVDINDFTRIERN